MSMAAQLSPLSASVTRILSLSGFPSELKTRDIQAAFGDWENVNGGFKIKWRDDTSLLIVFADPATAKRAYLSAIAQPPAVLQSPTTSKTAIIRPYDGPDAQQVISAVNARVHQHSGSRGHHSRSSISSPINGLPRSNNGNGNGSKGHGTSASISHINTTTAQSNLNGLVTIPEPATLSFPRDHSPTLPNVPAHPTLTSLINLSLSPGANGEEGELFVPTTAGNAAVPIVPPNAGDSDSAGTGSSTPEVAAASVPVRENATAAPPRIGDPGKRMVGHALGIRHPGLGSPSAGGDSVGRVTRGLSGLSISEE